METDGILHVVWRQRRLALAVAGGCLFLAIFYLAVAPRIYASTALLYVEQHGPAMLSDRTTAASQAQNYLRNQAVLIRSTPIIALAVSSPQLQELPGLTRQPNRLAYVQRQLEVQLGRQNDTMLVSFRSRQPEESAQIVNAVVAAYIDYQSKQRRSTAVEALRFFQRERQKVDEELAHKTAEMLEFKRTEGTLSFEGDRANLILHRLGSLSEALTAAHIDAINARSAYEAAKDELLEDEQKLRQFNALLASGRAAAANEAMVQQELHHWQQRLQELQTQLLPDHPTVQAVQNRVDRLSAAYVGALHRRWQSAEQRERQLQRSFDHQQDLAMAMNAKAVEYAALESEVRTLREQSSSLINRIHELSVIEEAPLMNVTVWEEGRPAQRPVEPGKLKVLAIALVLGLVLGSGSALVWDWVDQRVRSAEQVKQTLNLPVLGSIPRAAHQPLAIHRAQVVSLEPASAAAEAYRTLWTAIHFAAPEGRARTILIASPGADDGKTTLSCNLAIAMAKAGRRTLLIDADLRLPMVQQVFGLRSAAGLADVLGGRTCLADAIQSGPVGGLDLLPAGTTPDDPVELLNSESLNELLQDLAERYDQVVVDSPPVLPLADARILAASCDAALLVLRVGRTSRKASQAARDGLMSVGGNILGVVVNDVPEEHSYGRDWSSRHSVSEPDKLKLELRAQAEA